MRSAFILMGALSLVTLAACVGPGEERATPTPCPPCREEAIVIDQPLLNSTVTSPVHIEGVSDPTFEQIIEFQVLGEDGRILGQGHTTIEANVGERGTFSVDIEFTPPATEEHGRIVVFATSARDGGITHLSSVEVTLGAAE
ncbi:MAG: Gmad2 immunoglobulin-like domain-containing protein [Anaerolineae bacterium]